MKYPVIIILVAIMSASGITAARPPKAQPAGVKVQPLTYANVVSFFKEAQFRATEVQKRCTVFFEGEWKTANIYNYCLIIVENSDEDIQVTFYLTDAHEMNWVTEFLDSPFFSKSETQRLFGMIHSNNGGGSENLGRFRADFHRWKPRHAHILVFTFTPLR